MNFDNLIQLCNFHTIKTENSIIRVTFSNVILEDCLCLRREFLDITMRAKPIFNSAESLLLVSAGSGYQDILFSYTQFLP